jgi:hypothetical protein
MKAQDSGLRKKLSLFRIRPPPRAAPLSRSAASQPSGMDESFSGIAGSTGKDQETRSREMDQDLADLRRDGGSIGLTGT